MTRNIIGYAAVAGFATTIPTANWLIGNVGTTCIPNGPCLIPVAPGVLAPSGVLVIGLALVLRDMVHEYLGVAFAVAAILVGAVLSATFAPGSLVVASAVAFLLSEFADLSVYAPLRKRNLMIAVLASGFVGAVVDSGVFLYLAFGSFDHITGQVIGKMWAALFALPVLSFWHQRIVRP